MSYAVLFAGQGGQHSSFPSWVESEPEPIEIVASLDQRLDADWRTLLHDEGWRNRNRNAQLFVTAISLAAWATLAPKMPGPPAIVAGYSVGELAAFSCAGVISVETALDLASQRAILMDQAVAGKCTGLLSVSGVGEAVSAQWCAALDLECAIRIAPDHAIYAGSDAMLFNAMRVLTSLGAACKRLPIQVASHSSWMHSAALRFAVMLDAVPFGDVSCPVAVNADGISSRDAPALKLALSRQLETTVQWGECMCSVAERGVACAIEIGQGSALSRMWNARYPETPARAIEEFRNAGAISDWVWRHSQA